MFVFFVKTAPSTKRSDSRDDATRALVPCAILLLAGVPHRALASIPIALREDIDFVRRSLAFVALEVRETRETNAER